MKKNRKIFVLSRWARDLCRRAQQVREEASVTQKELGAIVGLTGAGVSAFEQGRLGAINLVLMETIVNLTASTGHAPGWLLTGQEAAASADPVQQLWAQLHELAAAQLRASGRPIPIGLTAGGVPLDLAEAIAPAFELTDAWSVPPDWQGRFVPVIGRLVAGEQPGVPGTGRPRWAHVYVRFEGAPAEAFALEVQGQSMSPGYRHGDIVIVDAARRADRGVCVCLCDEGGERIARLKDLRPVGRRARLLSRAPGYPPIELPAAAVQAFQVWRHLPAIRSLAGGAGGPP